MLAEDESTVALGGRRAYLRPSLRAAFRLERKFDGFDKLLRALSEESVTAMAAVIRECSDDPDDAAGVLESLEHLPLRRGIEALKEPLIAHVFRLANHDGSERLSEEAARITFAEHHTQLYRIATGWLGWEPDVAWDATEAEIIEAQKGRVEMLKAIFGSGKDELEDATPPSDEAFNSKILAFTKAMGTRKVIQ